jgi:hypothetical protein
VSRFMPAYETYLSALYQRGPQRADLRPELSAPASVTAQQESSPRRSPVLKVSMGCCMIRAYPQCYFMCLLCRLP